MLGLAVGCALERLQPHGVEGEWPYNKGHRGSGLIQSPIRKARPRKSEIHAVISTLLQFQSWIVGQEV